MAQINKPSEHFNTKLYTGTGATHNITGVGFQPDWVWLKNRNTTNTHEAFDSIRGATKTLYPDRSDAEYVNASGSLTSFNSDGFTVGSGDGANKSGSGIVSWNWKAAGTAPTKTYTVKVVSDSGNKYRFDDFGTSAVTLELSEGGTYTFDQSDSSNSGHPLRFYTASDKTGGEYTTGVTTTGTPGSSGAYTRITVASSAPTLYYQCSAHAGMGGQANTPTTNSFSDFEGSIQSNVSANTTAGFSIVSYTGTGSNATVGHGLSSAPEFITFKNRNDSSSWLTYLTTIGAGNFLRLNETNVSASGSTPFNNTASTSSVFSVGANNDTNGSSDSMIAYCFSSVKGYSKIGSYTGNGNANGTFIYTGFKPAFVMIKEYSGAAAHWMMYDNKREGYNVDNDHLKASASDAEGTSDDMDLLSNGFKMRTTGGGENGSGDKYIYMAFAEQPLVGTNNVPATAR